MAEGLVRGGGDGGVGQGESLSGCVRVCYEPLEDFAVDGVLELLKKGEEVYNACGEFLICCRSVPNPCFIFLVYAFLYIGLKITYGENMIISEWQIY